MRIFKRDLRHGVVKLAPENLDDLWYLGQMLRPGDLVKGQTVRRIKGKDDKVRSDAGRRETLVLEVRLEGAELDQETNRLRATGTIEQGREDLIVLGSHHTLEIGPNDAITITKGRWGDSDLGLLKDAEESSKRPKLIVVVVDEGEAVISVVRESGVSYANIRGSVGGKEYDKGRDERKKEFYNELLEAVKNTMKNNPADKLILAGSGFEKKNFFDYARGIEKVLMSRALVVDTGGDGKSAVQEVLNRGLVEKVVEENRLMREAQLVEKLLAEIAREGAAAYGTAVVERAAESGAVETLLISDSFLRKNRAKVESLIKKAKQTGARFHIANTEYEPGKKLDNLGGVAALLRYKTYD